MFIAIATVLFIVSSKGTAQVPRSEAEQSLLVTSNLLFKFVESGNTNSLIELTHLVTNRLMGPNAAASLRIAIPRAKDNDIATIIVPGLIRGLRCSIVPIRRESAIALGSAGKKGAQAAPALIDLIRTDDSDARNFGIEALGKLGPLASNSVPALLKILDGPASIDVGIGSSSTRVLALAALSKIEPRAQPSDLVLLKTLKDENPYMRIKSAALMLKRRINVSGADGCLATSLSADDSDLRLFAIGELLESGYRSCSPELRQRIIGALSDSDEFVKEQAKALLNSLTK